MLIIYEICLLIYVICYLPFIFIRGKWHHGFWERLGFISQSSKLNISGADSIWVHAVSVGEVTAIAELIKSIKKKYPDSQIVLTVSTKTGYELAMSKFSHMASVMWSPLDFTLSVKSFISIIKPGIYLVAETELWPNLFSQLHKKRIPILLINGRISDLSIKKYLRLRWFMKPYLRLMDSLCMQSQLDVERIVSMGALVEQVKKVGNIKFDDLPDTSHKTADQLGFNREDWIWVAGSTHPGEEDIVLEVLQRIKSKYSRLRLVIAPRHIERSDLVFENVLSKGFSALKYSDILTGPLKAESVVVVDKIGHLRELYSLATVVFVGKSLTVQGGHNIIEPAFFAKPVIIGPHMQNFRDVTAAFKANQAIIEVRDVDELTCAIDDLLSHPQKMTDLGIKAKAVIQSQQGATQRIMNEIALFMEKRT